MDYDFANILFSGPCNRFCPWCIGKQIPVHINRNSLNIFPPHNIDRLIDEVNRLDIKQIVFTGTNTDPQLYRYEAELLKFLRARIKTNAQYSLHTNGAMALRKIDTVNLYDKVCFSFPSFNPDTYEKLMGSRSVPPMATIIARLQIPVKISCVVNDYNFHEMGTFLNECNHIGVPRVVLRRLFGDIQDRNPFKTMTPYRFYRDNPVYDIGGMEVTYWNFDESSSNSINLFPDGTLGTSYLLTETPEFKQEAA